MRMSIILQDFVVEEFQVNGKKVDLKKEPATIEDLVEVVDAFRSISGLVHFENKPDKAVRLVPKKVGPGKKVEKMGKYVIHVSQHAVIKDRSKTIAVVQKGNTTHTILDIVAGAIRQEFMSKGKIPKKDIGDYMYAMFYSGYQRTSVSQMQSAYVKYFVEQEKIMENLNKFNVKFVKTSDPGLIRRMGADEEHWMKFMRDELQISKDTCEK